MPDGTLKVEGLRDLQRALRSYDKSLASELTRRLKEAASIVRDDASARFSRINAASAAGFKPRARGGSAFVEQSQRRTTGTRPDFGSLQMKLALLPALESKSGEVEQSIEHMLDEIGSQEGF